VRRHTYSSGLRLLQNTHPYFVSRTIAVSVPYSSGLRLLPDGIAARKYARQCFSPLLIGIEVATMAEVDCRSGRPEVSVPYSSGLRLLRQAPCGYERRGIGFQSPTHRD